jgi:hypothetical protein
VVWQSVDIKGEVAANAAKEPCRPTAKTKIRAMSPRFIRQSLTGTAGRRKLPARTVAPHRHGGKRSGLACTAKLHLTFYHWLYTV